MPYAAEGSSGFLRGLKQLLNGVCILEKMRRRYGVMNSTSFAQFVTKPLDWF